ncbi:hypothetical protein Q3H92_01020, partial [Curtobacterium flaccumfaciens]|nr:hypothetical protein [Curtobacterium flaccumfaciens]
MSTDHDDDGLAPVTDLFGARSRRRAPVTPVTPAIPEPPVSPDEPRDTDGWALPESDEGRPDEIPASFDADSPVPLHGA